MTTAIQIKYGKGFNCRTKRLNLFKLKSGMKTTAIKQRLHQFIETAEDRKLKAMYTLFEDDIRQNEWEYTDEFKEELDRRNAEYINGKVKMISASRADSEIAGILKKSRKK